MKLRDQLLDCGFDGGALRLNALVEWLRGEDVLGVGHLVGAPPPMVRVAFPWRTFSS